jgi:hypothetical protein
MLTELLTEPRPALGDYVYLAYVDDSKQDKTRDRFQVISAILINDIGFAALEQELGYYLYELVQPLVGADFEEFHATDLLNGNGVFRDVKREQAIEIFRSGVKTLWTLQIPVIYGAVNLDKLYATDYATANPVDMAFRLCLKLIEAWFQENRPGNMALLISDDGDKGVKNAMQNTFHVLRKPVVSSPPVRGDLPHLHDDMYFGASKFSKGIQLADLCALLIGRHLAGYSDTEDLYRELSEHIVASMVKPG